MGKTFEGNLIAKGLRFGIVISRFNDTLGKELLRGAKDTLLRHGVSDKDVDISWVPGAFEIPLIAKCMAEKDRYDAIICLGVVIRGATAHFEYVAGQAASGIAAVSLSAGVPVTFGILTTETIEQAIERAGTKGGNYGSGAAMAAIEMVNILDAINGE